MIGMQLIPSRRIEGRCSARGGAGIPACGGAGIPACRCTTGVAEIELILSVTVLITILMLLQSAMRIGVARLTASKDASFQAYHNATAGDVPQYTDDPTAPLVEGLAAIRPGMPNRVHSPHPSSKVAINTGTSQPLAPLEIRGSTAVPAPFWVYTAYPVADPDQALTEQWFCEFGSESHTAFSDSLGLAPAWPP
jgi:hypothetical protein